MDFPWAYDNEKLENKKRTDYFVYSLCWIDVCERNEEDVQKCLFFLELEFVGLHIVDAIHLR